MEINSEKIRERNKLWEEYRVERETNSEKRREGNKLWEEDGGKQTLRREGM